MQACEFVQVLRAGSLPERAKVPRMPPGHLRDHTLRDHSILMKMKRLFLNILISYTNTQMTTSLIIGLEDEVGVEGVLPHEFVEPFVYSVQRDHQEPICCRIIVL